MAKYYLMPNATQNAEGRFRPIVRVLDTSINQLGVAESVYTFSDYGRAIGFAVMRTQRLCHQRNIKVREECICIPPAAEVRWRHA